MGDLIGLVCVGVFFVWMFALIFPDNAVTDTYDSKKNLDEEIF